MLTEWHFVFLQGSLVTYAKIQQATLSFRSSLTAAIQVLRIVVQKSVSQLSQVYKYAGICHPGSKRSAQQGILLCAPTLVPFSKKRTDTTQIYK